MRVRARVYMGDQARGSTHACARVALFINIRRNVTSFVVPLAPPYFFTLSHKRYDFREKGIAHKMCFIFGTTVA